MQGIRSRVSHGSARSGRSSSWASALLSVAESAVSSAVRVAVSFRCAAIFGRSCARTSAQGWCSHTASSSRISSKGCPTCLAAWMNAIGSTSRSRRREIRCRFALPAPALRIQALLPLVRVVGRLPTGVGRRFAQVPDAGTRPFDVLNYYGSCAVAISVARSGGGLLYVEVSRTGRDGMFSPPR